MITTFVVCHSDFWAYIIAKAKAKNSFVGLQEFVVGYSKALQQPQSSSLYVILTL